MISDQKICSSYKEVISKELDRIEKELTLDNTYGGFEAKLEEGDIVHFKYWVSRKIKIR